MNFLKLKSDQYVELVPRSNFSLHEMIAEANKVTTRKTISGMHSSELFGIPATGKKVAITVIDILTIDNGKIIEHWGENNFGAVMQSLQA